MEELPAWAPALGLVTLVGVFIALAFWYERRRKDALDQASARLGMSFSQDDPELHDPALRELPLFQKGRARKLLNVASGADRWIFGYRYTVGSGKSSSICTQTVAAFRNRRAAFPYAYATPEGVFDRVGTSFGGQDLDFEGAPEFSKRYRLRGRDEAAVRELFAPSVRQQLGAEPAWSLELCGEWIVVYHAKQRVSPDDLAQFAEQTRRLAALFE